MAKVRWLGIDFSGNHLMWRPGCRRSNVWIAEASRSGTGLVLSSLRRVQELPGAAHPFNRLVGLLRTGKYAVAAIDAPFSVPAGYLGRRRHSALLNLVRAVPREAGLPFPTGSQLTAALLRPTPERGLKAYRATEKEWIANGVAVRSTLWTGPRGGAPMTAACLALLAAARRPMWPWSRSRRRAI